MSYLPIWRIGISCRVMLLSCIPSAEVSANGKAADIRKGYEQFHSDGLRSDLLPFLHVLFLSKKEVEQMLDRPLECTVLWDWQCLFEPKGNTVHNSMCLSRSKHTPCPVYNPITPLSHFVWSYSCHWPRLWLCYLTLTLDVFCNHLHLLPFFFFFFNLFFFVTAVLFFLTPTLILWTVSIIWESQLLGL